MQHSSSLSSVSLYLSPVCQILSKDLYIPRQAMSILCFCPKGFDIVSYNVSHLAQSVLFTLGDVYEIKATQKMIIL